MNHSIRVYPINSAPCGKPWYEWVQRWWQWCYSEPYEKSPVYDRVGESCTKGQIYEDVWFLAGTFGGKAERKCRISNRRSIFFPILNDIISFATDPYLKTEQQLRSYANADLDETKFLYVNIDGSELKDLKQYRIDTPIFEIRLPSQQQPEQSYVTTKAVSDGYWIFLEPLPIGEHRIQFIGEKLEFDKIRESTDKSIQLPTFRVEVKYNLTVY
jgi:hypothetical protein